MFKGHIKKLFLIESASFFVKYITFAILIQSTKLLCKLLTYNFVIETRLTETTRMLLLFYNLLLNL